jgi:hypothetical protein
MKNAILSLTALTLFTVAFSSCKKDPTFKDQLVGNWKSIEVKAGANDLTSSNSYDLRLQSTNEFDLDVTYMLPLTGKVIQSYDGNWATDDAKQDVTLTYNGSGDVKTWEITAISDLNMTAELLEDNVRYQVTFKKQ